MASGAKSPEKITLVHIEDDPLWIEAVAKQLSHWPEFNHLGYSAAGGTGLAYCRLRRPDLVLLDLGLPDMDGFHLGGLLAALPDPPWVLVLTCHCDEATLHRIGDAPFAGLIWKTTRFREHLRPALTTVAAGGRYFPREVRDTIRRARASPSAFSKLLTRDEMALLPHFAHGDTDAQIAATTGRSAATVKWHRRQIMAKLGLHDTPALMRWARGKGFDDRLRPVPPCMFAE